MYNLTSLEIVKEQNISEPKEWVETNDWIVYYWGDDNLYKIETNWNISKILLGKEITTNLVYDINWNEVVFCEQNNCFRVEATNKEIKMKNGIVTNYEGKKQIIMPVDRSWKTEYIIFD